VRTTYGLRRRCVRSSPATVGDRVGIFCRSM
jgi:hypothetical protein